MKTLVIVAILVGCAMPSLVTAQTLPQDPKDKKGADVVTVTDPGAPPEVDKKIDAETAKEDSKQTDLEKLNASIKAKRDSDPITARPIMDDSRSLTKKSLSFPKQSSSSSEWQFGFAPYLFAAGITGTVGARGRTLEIESDFTGGVWESLDFGLMGAFEARKGRLVTLTDMMWIKLSKEEDTPGRFYNTAKLGINFFMIDPEVGYRMVDSDRYALDVLGGVRIWSVETNLNVTTGVLPGFDVSQRKTWAAPVVGLHGVANITPKFFLAGKFDIGGAGIGADLTTQLYGALGYRVTKHVALVGGYRWLQVDYDDDEGFLFDTQMQGLMFGAKFSF